MLLEESQSVKLCKIRDCDGPLRADHGRRELCGHEFRQDQDGVQAEKHSAGVRNYPEEDSCLGATSLYSVGKDFLYDYVHRMDVVTIAIGSETSKTIWVNPQRQPLKSILLLFIEPGNRGGEKFGKGRQP